MRQAGEQSPAAPQTMTLTEVKTLEPMWHGAKPVPAGTVLPMQRSDAVYLAGIKRVEIIEAEQPAKPARKRKAD